MFMAVEFWRQKREGGMDGVQWMNRTHFWPLESDLRPWSTARPKAYVSHDAEQPRGRELSHSFTVVQPEMQFFTREIYAQSLAEGREGGFGWSSANYVQLINKPTRCRWFWFSLFFVFMETRHTLDWFLSLIMLLMVSAWQSLWGYWDSGKRVRTLTLMMMVMVILLCDITCEATLKYSFNFVQLFLPFLRFLLNFDRLAKAVRDLMLEASFYFAH